MMTSPSDITVLDPQSRTRLQKFDRLVRVEVAIEAAERRLSQLEEELETHRSERADLLNDLRLEDLPETTG